MIEVIKAHSPKWGDHGKTRINLIVEFSHIPGELPFTANPKDVTQHGPDLYHRALAGEFGDIAPCDGATAEELAMQRFEVDKARKTEEVEQRIAILSRAARLKMATTAESMELVMLEKYSIKLMRAEGPELPPLI